MVYKKLELKDYFSFLGEGGRNPTLEIYLPYNMVEMKREKQKENKTFFRVFISLILHVL